ncbi:MAG: xylulokinase [Anaerolineae bacterium]|nr:xylulokinase [Anaerolineae bacterium]
MTHLLGIDLGTSSVKVVVIDETGRLLGVGNREYPIHTPRPNWAEQDPEDWRRASIDAARQALTRAGLSGESIVSIGFSGQMHGFALVDEAGAPVGPAIIWPDQRSVTEVQEITDLLGVGTLADVAGTAPATGFLAPTMRWLRKHDAARLDASHAALMPKDYVRLHLTGEMATDASDASATAAFDQRRRAWSQDIIARLDLPARLLPRVIGSADAAGTLMPKAADALGLRAGIPVATGAADQAAQAVANGLLDPGFGAITIGTGGQLFMPLTTPRADPQLRLHTFCHGHPARWYALGAMLSAGLSLRWLRNTIGMANDPDAYPKLAALAANVPPGADGLLFLPYLVGERSPIMDPRARGTFVGLALRHELGHLVRAIMEGVAFAMRQILDIMLDLGGPVEGMLAAGNGLGSDVWRQLTADILNRPLRLSQQGERSGAGAAFLGGIAAGVYPDFEAVRDLAKRAASPILTEPDPARARFYDERYGRFLEVYPALRPVMHELHGE